MADSDGRQNVEKSALEAEKLSLETRLLQRQLSVQGFLMGWLQAASVPVALAGAILAFFVGFGQLRQGADNQVADRFDKALTRLASQQPDERMTGVSGLNLFLGDGNPLLQKQALQFLINGLSLETDLRVQGAILDVLADLTPGSPSQVALDAGLRIAVERDRSLTRSIVDNWPKRILQQKKQTLAKFKLTGLDLNEVGDAIPARVLAALSVDQYLALLDAEHGPFESLDPSENLPLIGLSTAIQTLVARGAISDDFKNIFCEECNFSTAKSLDRAIFDSAYLARANFAHVSLRGASFRNADIGGTNFFGADLTKADLRVEIFFWHLANKGLGFQLPLLECAKLGGADLSGQPLVLFEKEFRTTSRGDVVVYNITLPLMISVQLDTSTKLDTFSIITATEISDDYVKKHGVAPAVQPLTTNRFGATWENPLTTGESSAASLWRLHGTFGEYVSKNTETIVMAGWEYEDADLKRLSKDAFMLRGYVEQPALKALPLYSRFVDTVEALGVPDNREGTAARAWSDEAAKIRATMKPLSCSDDPGAFMLLFDLGYHANTDGPEQYHR